MQRYICGFVAAAAAATVSITVQKNGRLRGVSISASSNAEADGTFEVLASRDGVRPSPISGSALNGQTNVLAAVVESGKVAGATNFSSGQHVFIPLDETVGQGEMLYAHLDLIGTIACFATVIYYVE